MEVAAQRLVPSAGLLIGFALLVPLAVAGHYASGTLIAGTGVSLAFVLAVAIGTRTFIRQHA